MTETLQVGPTDRERWLVSNSVKAAAQAADTMYSSANDEREYGRGELVMTAKLLTEGDYGLSRNQLENLRDFVQLALDCLD